MQRRSLGGTSRTYRSDPVGYCMTREETQKGPSHTLFPELPFTGVVQLIEPWLVTRASELVDCAGNCLHFRTTSSISGSMANTLHGKSWCTQTWGYLQRSVVLRFAWCLRQWAPMCSPSSKGQAQSEQMSEAQCREPEPLSAKVQLQGHTLGYCAQGNDSHLDRPRLPALGSELA